MKTLIATLMAVCLLCSANLAANDRAWQRTFNKISSGVLAIRVDQTRAFDGQFNRSTEATGFIVDARRGIVLTNRHVVNPGPVIARGTFPNREEVALTALYRDPVHDFGFFRYDPAELRHGNPAQLELAPNAARQGSEIWVIGNDDGEQLSILQGTLARTDRQAPNYGRGRYNDFNTFYFQAASGMSGGASGSPVVNRRGQVVALAAGANRASAASFFLPLDRVVRALKLLQASQPVPRGTIQTTFVHRSFSELRRNGLRDAEEQRLRDEHPELKGLLNVTHVLPGSPAAEQLQVGDVLISANGADVTDFVSLSSLLDGNVGKTVRVQIERQGTPLNVPIRVDDLHAMSPREFIEFDGSVIHPLSFQQARHYNRATDTLFVAEAGFSLKNSNLAIGDLLTEMNGTPLRSLDDLEQVLANSAPGTWTTARSVNRSQPLSSRFNGIRIDRLWHPSRRCARNDQSGLWDCRDLAPPAKSGDQADEAHAVDTANSSTPAISGASDLKHMFVNVKLDMPYWVLGLSASRHSGTGVIVDARRGWVLVDRTTVPTSAGNLSLVFGGTTEVPAELVYMHPTHNLVIIGYDPSKVAHLPIREAQLSDDQLTVGQAVTVAGIDSRHMLTTQETTVASLRHTVFPNTQPPKFASATVRTARLANGPEHFEGVLLNAQERVGAFWLSYGRQNGREMSYRKLGVDAELVSDTLNRLRANEAWLSLEVDWQPRSLADSIQLGLPAAAASERTQLGIDRVFAAVRVHPQSKDLEIGDLLLKINGAIPESTRHIEQASQRDSISLSILRNGKVLEANVTPTELKGVDMSRLFVWAGGVFHQPHRALSLQANQPLSGAYVSSYQFGSPASRFKLDAASRVVEVDGKQVDTLDDLISVVATKQHGDAVRLKTVNRLGEPKLISLLADHVYWPPFEVRRVHNRWERVPVTAER